MTWPVRTRICLECRAALSDGEQCTWVRHTAVAPADPAERRRLIEAVWGSDALAPRRGPASWFARYLEQLLQPRGDPMSSPVLEVPPPPARFGNVGHDRAGGPHGAGEEPLWTARTRYLGRVGAGAVTEPSPIAGTPCVAYGLWLCDREAGGSPILLRDGASRGFDVELGDGRAARIPAGTIDLVAPGVRLRRRGARLESYLRHLAPDGPERRRPSPLPFREVREAVLRPGDRMTLLADLQPVPDARRAGGSAYRDAVAAVLVPLGRVAIEVGQERVA